MEFVAAGIVVITLFVARASRQVTAGLLATILYYQLAGVTDMSLSVHAGVLLFVIATKVLGWL